MSTAKQALARHTDPLTIRIYSTALEQGLSVKFVADTAGIEGTTWRRRARTGTWRTKELQRIAKVLGVSFEWLVAALNEEAAA